MKRNPGHVPIEAAGKRVRGVLANGWRFGFEDKGAAPAGWPADGNGGCRWSRLGQPADIEQYEVIA